MPRLSVSKNQDIKIMLDKLMPQGYISTNQTGENITTMALTLHAVSEPEKSILKLDPKKFGQAIRDYLTALRAKSEANKAARVAENATKTLQSVLESAMNGHSAAMCGNSVLSWRDTQPASACLTLNDGTKIEWADVTSILVGNTTYRREDITTIYGGRSGSHTLNVEGTP